MAATAKFSFQGLSIEDATLPERSSKEIDPALVGALEASYKARTKASNKGGWLGAAKSVKVPAANVAQAVNMIRDAAASLDLGSRIDYTTTQDAPLTRRTVGAKPLVKDGRPVFNKDGKTPRMTGGHAEFFTAGDSRHTGIVKVVFAANPPQERKESTPSA